jgi:hypothetical protein
MKRVLLSLFVLSLLFTTSCSEDIQNNSPAIQGQIDSLFFKAIDIRGQVNDNGSISLKGSDQDQELTLNVTSATPGVYQLGPGSNNFAIFDVAQGNSYATSPTGEGKITITDHCSSCGHITGTFNFVGINPGVDTIFMQKGVFYQVDYLLGGIDGDASDGSMSAVVNGESFYTEILAADETGGTVIINGFLDNVNISIRVPANATPGNYPIGTPGYDASITVDNVVEVATSGRITVNFLNSTTRRGLVFFEFNTDNYEITNGRTDIRF